MVDPLVIDLCQAVSQAGGRALIVGGWVRDHLLARENHDYDIEVYGIDAGILKSLLASLGSVNAVGESYTVYKVRLRMKGRSLIVDVSLPRRESKIGRGHRAFLVSGDPTMSIEEASRRRDFTINAILFDPLSGEILDPHGGREDLRHRLLRVVDPLTFTEDSLRVLRAVQFAARFEFTIDQATIELCRAIDLSDLPPERILAEMEKWLLVAEHPSIGLFAAHSLGVIHQLWPELERVDPQQLAASLDRARGLVNDLPYPKRLTVMLAVICRSFDADPEPFLERLHIHTLNHYRIRQQIIALFRERGRPLRWHRDLKAGKPVTNGDLRRLAIRLEPGLLARVERASGDDATSTQEALGWFESRLRQLDIEINPPAPILLGRHLLALGLQPGPRIGEISRAAYDLQLDDQIVNLDQALAAARSLIDSRPEG